MPVATCINSLVDVYSKVPTVPQLYGTLNTCICYECTCGAADMPLCLSLWAMHSAERHQPSCTSCTDANLARAQMSSGWLAGWLAGCHRDTHLEMCAKCMSHTVACPAEDSPRHTQSSNAARLATAPPLAAVASRM